MPDMKAAIAWGAQREIQNGPLTRAQSALASIDKAYEDISIDLSEDGGLTTAIKPETRVRDRSDRSGVRVVGGREQAQRTLIEAASRWVVEATPDVAWPAAMSNNADRVRIGMGDPTVASEAKTALGEKLGELAASGDNRSFGFGQAALATLKDAGFERGNEGFRDIANVTIDSSHAPALDLNIGR